MPPKVQPAAAALAVKGNPLPPPPPPPAQTPAPKSKPSIAGKPTTSKAGQPSGTKLTESQAIALANATADEEEGEEEQVQVKEVKPEHVKHKKDNEDDFDDMDDSELQKFVNDEEGGVNPWADLLEEAAKEAEAAAAASEAEFDEETEEEGSEEGEGGSEGEEGQESESSKSSDQFEFRDAISEESLDYDERRYLIDTHSFLHLKDPGLETALLLEEKPPEKVYKGLKAEKHNYKKLCDDLGVKPLQAFLDHLNSEIMDLRNYGLGAKDMVAIAKTMCNNTVVKTLLLSGNFAGQEGGDALAEMIENNYNVTHLDIGGTMILPSMKKICEAITMNIALESLDFSMNELTDKEMPYITGFMYDNTTLGQLFLQHNKITDVGLSHLAKGLNTKPKKSARVKKGPKPAEMLQLLDLGWNRIKGEKLAAPFFEAVATHTRLDWLNLAGNSINNAKGVARVLGGNANLEFMDVGYNRLDEKACPLIGKNLAFSKSPYLTKFVAGPNLWRQKKASTLILPLASRKSTVPLKTLDMSLGMCISRKFLKSKRKVWKAKPELEIIHSGSIYGLPSFKKPNPQAITIRRAKTVCENFETPLEMLIDELRTEPKSMRQEEFKKFIKSCNLYKDKVLTETFFQYFPKGNFEVDCQAIIDAYDAEYPKPKKVKSKRTAGMGGTGGTGGAGGPEEDEDEDEEEEDEEEEEQEIETKVILEPKTIKANPTVKNLDSKKK